MKWIVVVVRVGVTVLLGSYMHEALYNAWRVPETPKTPKIWNMGILNSWRMREQLPYYWWLGPILQNTLLVPVKNCVLHAGRPWWVLLLRAHETRHLLCRLKDTKKARNNHRSFSKIMMWFGVFFVLLALGLYAMKLLFFTLVFPNILSSLPTRYWETIPDNNSGKESDPALSNSCL